jgi:DNA-binding XRE family transcriptional regulator
MTTAIDTETRKMPYMCSCGDTFSGLALLETHLDLLADDTDQHVELTADGASRLVAWNIRRYRLEHGMLLREVATLLDVDVSTVSRIESGQRHTSYVLNPRIAATLLDVPLCDLLSRCPQCGYQPPAGYRCLRCGMGSRC